MRARYRNPWHRPGQHWSSGQEFFETDVRPHKYRGYLIYHRGGGWDVVLDGVCIRQMAGFQGAKRAVDAHLEGQEWPPGIPFPAMVNAAENISLGTP